MTTLRVHFCAFFLLIPASRVGSAEPGEPPRGDNSRQIVVWIRSATDSDMRLSREAAPTLRALAREGTSFPELPHLKADDVLTQLRSLRDALKSGYQEAEVGAEPTPRPKEAPDSDSITELVKELGSPPPESEEERQAVERLRRAATGKTQAGSGSQPTPGPLASGASTDARALLAAGKRLIVALDPFSGAPQAEAGASKDRDGHRDRALADLVDAVRQGGERKRKGGRDRSLLVLLIPGRGRPALIALGPSFRKGRVSRQPVSPAELASGVAHLLGLPQPPGAYPLSGPPPSWLGDFLPENATAGEGGKP